jgi:hypothetical protein
MFVELCGKFTPNNTLVALKPKGVIQTYKSYCNSNFKKMIRTKRKKIIQERISVKLAICMRPPY